MHLWWPGDRLAVFTWERIPRKENGCVANVFEAAPDWIIEILSPDQSATKVTQKIMHGLNFETEMGWLIDPDDRTLLVYRDYFAVPASKSDRTRVS